MLEGGDLEGQRVWLRILNVIKDIQNTNELKLGASLTARES